MSTATVTPAELSTRLQQSPSLILLDVRLADDFASCHLPGAKNNCVFEVAFADRLRDIAPDLSTPICVYGFGPDSRESSIAAEKLLRLGYTDVLDLTAGLGGWKSDHLPLEGLPASASSPILDGAFDLDLAESRVQWTGSNLLNKHHGTVALKSGHIRFEHGLLSGGEFVFDLHRLACADLSGDKLHDVLIAHLASDDFFDVERFPEARFVITQADPIPHATPGALNLIIHGALTIKDITRPVAFEAATGLTPDGKPAAQATLTFDRTLWNVLYGSGKFFRHLAGHLVNDLIELHLRIVTK